MKKIETDYNCDFLKLVCLTVFTLLVRSKETLFAGYTVFKV